MSTNTWILVAFIFCVGFRILFLILRRRAFLGSGEGEILRASGIDGYTRRLLVRSAVESGNACSAVDFVYWKDDLEKLVLRHPVKRKAVWLKLSSSSRFDSVPKFYTPQIRKKLETSLREGKERTECSAAGKIKLSFNLKTLTEDSKRGKARILRDESETGYDPEKVTGPVKLEKLDFESTQPVFLCLEQKFHDRVQHVYKVNSPRAYFAYQTRKILIAKEEKKLFSETREAYGWHGTSIEAIENILENGFDISKSKYGSLGYGIYFAQNAEYSLGYSRSKEGSDPQMASRKYFSRDPRVLRLMLCRIIISPNDSELKTARTTVSVDRYGKSTILAIHHASQALPEYIVELARTD